MFEKLLESGQHVPPHKIWAFIVGELRLTRAEQVHALKCKQCHHVVRICTASSTFGAVLKALDDEETSLAA